ncbi:Ig-like domain-containing protein [Vibrio cholerae]|uniref:Ig-like domain-containing protein n=3 Tax=Vibrio cholerae TaxID=666 RepID=UPI0018F1038A|nr:Ig-like domain-containing protein [Vibrio cholerae]MBJ6956622.1 Ig-like domain-containing protein [Vibrio cholerae]
MNRYFKSLFAIVIFPLLMLLTGCNSEGAFSESTVKLERIDITASPITTRGVSELTLAVGNKQPFEAVGHYSDGSSRTLTDLTVSDWRTSAPDAGRFDEPGVFTATNEGNTTLTATKDGVTSNTVDVNVSAACITSIQVTPSPVNVAKGQTQQLTATATFSDATSSDVSTSVTWTPIDTATATVSSAGLLSAVKVGNTTLTATKDSVTSNTVDVNVSAAFITSIQVTPSPVNVAKGQTQQLTATATFSDATSSDVSTSVTWTPIDTATATVSSAGLLSAVKVGNTTLTATKDSVTSNTVDVNVCADFAGTCIDIFDTGTGKLFTNSPSVAYLDSIGGSATDDIYTENGTYGPSGNFYRFNWTNANALCTTYNTLSLGGRTNWRLATRDELKVELYDAFGNMFTARGWPTTIIYWSASLDGSFYYSVNLYEVFVYGANPSNALYASCVSNP